MCVWFGFKWLLSANGLGIGDDPGFPCLVELERRVVAKVVIVAKAVFTRNGVGTHCAATDGGVHRLC